MSTQCFRYLLATIFILGQCASAMTAHAHAGISHDTEHSQPHVHFTGHQQHSHEHSDSHSHSHGPEVEVADSAEQIDATEPAAAIGGDDHDDDAVYLNGELNAIGAVSTFGEFMPVAISPCLYQTTAAANIFAASDFYNRQRRAGREGLPLYLAIQTLKI